MLKEGNSKASQIEIYHIFGSIFKGMYTGSRHYLYAHAH